MTSQSWGSVPRTRWQVLSLILGWHHDADGGLRLSPSVHWMSQRRRVRTHRASRPSNSASPPRHVGHSQNHIDPLRIGDAHLIPLSTDVKVHRRLKTFGVFRPKQPPLNSGDFRRTHRLCLAKQNPHSPRSLENYPGILKNLETHVVTARSNGHFEFLQGITAEPARGIAVVKNFRRKGG